MTENRRLPSRCARFLAICGIVAAIAVAGPRASAEEVGAFRNDWTGNGFVIEAFADPKVQGVTCHLVRFDRSLIDRLSKGNWFEDPSNSAISCRQTAPIVVGDIDADRNGEDVFSERRSLIFKALAVRRIYDRLNDTLVYVAYAREISNASAKMSLSTVSLSGSDVSWTRGTRPQ